MKILDVALLPPLLFLAGALRRASRILDLVAYVLDPGDPNDAPETPSRGSKVAPSSGDSTSFPAEVDVPPVLIPPEAGEMISKTPSPPNTRDRFYKHEPLAGSLEHRRQSAISRFEDFDQSCQELIMDMRKDGKGRC